MLCICASAGEITLLLVSLNPLLPIGRRGERYAAVAARFSICALCSVRESGVRL